IEPQDKQMKDWNKLQQEATTTLTSSLRSIEAQQDVGESSHPKLDWMIKWMQESGPNFQEFAKQKTIRVPNYTPNMFGPTNLE
ncbi:hypothetical protein J1N35_037531, partial [Gossypium stocksii]